MQAERGDTTLATPQTRPEGLTSEEARLRLARFGPNAVAEHRSSPFVKLPGYFWGPTPG
jgi:H+-transporting ATPase